MKKDKIYISGPISSRPLGVVINHFMLAVETFDRSMRSVNEA